MQIPMTFAPQSAASVQNCEIMENWQHWTVEQTTSFVIIGNGGRGPEASLMKTCVAHKNDNHDLHPNIIFDMIANRT